MKEVKVIKYEAEDGTQFNTAYECQCYEEEIADRETLKPAFQAIYNYCSKHNRERFDFETGEFCGCGNEKCPFNDGGIECKLCSNNTFYFAYGDIYNDYVNKNDK